MCRLNMQKLNNPTHARGYDTVQTPLHFFSGIWIRSLTEFLQMKC